MKKFFSISIFFLCLLLFFPISANATHQCVLGPVSRIDVYDAEANTQVNQQCYFTCSNFYNTIPLCGGNAGDTVTSDPTECRPSSNSCTMNGCNVNTRTIEDCTPITHPVDCVGSWSNWSACSVTACGQTGTQTRTYTITTPASNGGTTCPYANGATQSQSCSTAACTSYTCSGSPSADSSTWGSDESSPTTSGVSWAYSATDTATYCEYYCNSGYTYSGGSCVLTSTPPPPGAPTVDLTASPTSVNSGSASTLTWTVSGSPTSCSASGDWSGSKSITGGSQSTGNLTSAKNYTITCSNSYGSSFDSASVSVNGSSVTNGICGSAHNTVLAFASHPTSGSGSGVACLSGTYSNIYTGHVDTSEVYNWSCRGGTGGTHAYCYAYSPSARFDLNVYTVSGSGAITAPTGGGITCGTNGTDCAQSYVPNTSVTIRGTSATGYYTVDKGAGDFQGQTCQSGGWIYDCGPLIMNQDRTIGVRFRPVTYTLTTIVSPSNSGTISGVGISCSSSGGWQCSESVNHGTTVTLTATPASGYYRSGWGSSSSPCYGQGDVCTFIMDGNKSVTAYFSLLPPVATLTADPTSVPYNTSSTLTWSSTNGATGCTASGAWSGSKAASGSQSTGNLTSSKTYNLYCTGPGGQSSTVSATVNVGSISDPVPIVQCNVPANNQVRVTWTPPSSGASAYLYRVGNTANPPVACPPAGSDEACTGPITATSYTTDYTTGANYLASVYSCADASCTIVSPGASTGFTCAPPNVTLTTSVSPSGSGTISGIGISCGADCTEAYPVGTPITIIATPSSSSYNFSSWTGICSGQGSSCSFVIDANRSVTANFTQTFNYALSNSGNLSVTKAATDTYVQSTITKTLSAGTTQAIDLFISGVPSGVSYSIANQLCSPSCSSVINFTIAPTATIGTHPITVTGSPLNKTTSFNLVISGSPISATCEGSPSPALIGQDITWDVEPLGGGGSYNYSWVGDDIPMGPLTPTSDPYIKKYSTIGLKQASVTVTDTESGQFYSVACESQSGDTGVKIYVDPALNEF